MTPLLPTYTWLELMGFDPWHSFGIAGSGDLRVESGCDTLLRRYAWQNSDAASLTEIEQAIITAETKLADYLKFSPAPRYVTEVIPWPDRADGLLRWGAVGSDDRWLDMALSEGQLRAVGVETLSAISAAAAVAYTDVDGDTFEDTFTIGPLATTVTDPSEIAVYFSTGNRFTGWGATTEIGERWRVRPVRVVIAGGQVTITGPKQLCVKPIKYEGRVNVGSNGLDPSDAANFVTTLDVYRRYTDTGGTTTTTSQAVITWETRPCHGWWCCCGCQASDPYSGSPFDPAATAQATSRVGIRSARHGLITPAEASYDSTTGIWSALDWAVCTQPDRVTVRYLAGYPLGSDGLMQEPYRTLVARLAAAELARPVCGCDAANRELYRWQFDLSQTARGDELFGISQENLNNPLGTRRGQVYAWKQLQNLQQLTGFTA